MRARQTLGASPTPDLEIQDGAANNAMFFLRTPSWAQVCQPSGECLWPARQLSMPHFNTRWGLHRLAWIPSSC